MERIMDARLPDAFLKSVVELLPAQAPRGPQGGRPPIEPAIVLRVIWFVLTVGCRWKDVPRELGCSGETARMRLKRWEEANVWQEVHRLLLCELRRKNELPLETVMIDSVQVRAFGGGDRSGPSPVDRRKPGTKLTVLVDARGTPLVMQSAAANVSDHCQILSTVVSFPAIGGKPGRPRLHPVTLYADAGYDSEGTRDILRLLGIIPMIRRRKEPHGSQLGRKRWVVERTISWIKGLRRMRIRYDRHVTIINAWNHLALAAICFRILNQTT
jgi:transposase